MNLPNSETQTSEEKIQEEMLYCQKMVEQYSARLTELTTLQKQVDQTSDSPGHPLTEMPLNVPLEKTIEWLNKEFKESQFEIKKKVVAQSFLLGMFMIPMYLDIQNQSPFFFILGISILILMVIAWGLLTTVDVIEMRERKVKHKKNLREKTDQYTNWKIADVLKTKMKPYSKQNMVMQEKTNDQRA